MFPWVTGFGEARGARGVVASANPLASAAGARVLARGGNAVDAAVATAFVLSVVEPYSAGIGGGGFLVFHDARTGRARVADYREFAPRRASRDMYLDDGKPSPTRSLEGYGAVAVPAMVPGLAAAQAELGRLKLADVLDEAIELAEKGYRVDPRLFEATQDRQALLARDPEARRIFLDARGAPRGVGTLLVQPELARTLRALKKQGPRLFTHGAVAQAMARASRARGGYLELEDLARAGVRWREPLVGTFRGHTIVTMPPPSSGGTHLLQMLGLVERRSPTPLDLDRAESVHQLVEIMKLAYADRAEHMGDPAFYPVPLAELLAPSYLDARAALVTPGRARADVVAGRFAPSPSASPSPAGGPRAVPYESEETTHLSVIDADGNAVSLTQTVNYGYGAGVVVPGTGVLLNNEMDDFSIAPGTPNAYGLVGGEANSIQPGKVPLSSMTPTIVLRDGKVRLVVGAPGGSTIITTVLQAILRFVDGGWSAPRAIAAGRIHHQWRPDALRVEVGALTPAVEKQLEAWGHVLKRVDDGWGNAQVIAVFDDGTREGGADPRGVGGAVAE